MNVLYKMEKNGDGKNIQIVNSKWSLSQPNSKDYSCAKKKDKLEKCKDKQYLNFDHNLPTYFCSPCF